MEFVDYRNLAILMRDQDARRDVQFGEWDAEYHVDWELPDELRDVEWIRRVPGTEIYDVIETGERVLSASRIDLNKTPLIADDENRDEANRQERNLKWQLKNADRRRSRSTVLDLAESALRYAAIAAYLVDLDWQIKVLEDLGVSTKRVKAARRYGRFAVEVHNPQNVHVRRSVYGLEAVLLIVRKKAVEVMAEWGTLADELKPLADVDAYVTLWDYIDHEKRVIWAEPLEENLKTESAQPSVAFAQYYTILQPTEHGLEFIPWVALMGGSSLESDEEKKYRPMNYALHRGDLLNTLNIARSIWVSEIIKNAGAPRYAEEGNIANKTTRIDHTDPNRPVDVTPGNTLKPLPVPQGDPYLQQAASQVQALIEKGTLARVLQTGEFPSGTGFATLNLATQTAVGQLKPAKDMTEQALAEIFTLMLFWVNQTGIDLVAYGSDKRASDYGKEYKIEADSIDLETTYISVSLTPDLPTDRSQRAATAGSMIQWGYPREYALEDVGVNDATQALDLWYRERSVEHEFTMQQQRDIAEMQAGIREMAGQLQQMLQGLQNQQEQQDQARAQSDEQALADMGGDMFNPAQGTNPPGMFAPGMMTREAVTGMDGAGNPIQGVAPGGNGR